MFSKLRITTLWLAAIILASSAVQLSAQLSEAPVPDSKRILLLYSYGQNFQPWVTWSREIRRELNRQSPWPLNFQEHYVVTALGGDDAADAQFVEYLTALYAHARPDLIVAFGGPAARFVQQYRAGLFPKTPMLLAAVNVRRVTQALLSAEDAVVGTDVNNVVVFENILRLLPNTKTIAMMIGNSPPEKLWVEEIQRELKPLVGNKIKLLFFNERPFDEILEEVASLPPRSAIFFQQMMVDGTGAVYGDKEPLKRIYEAANAPIFTFDQSFFGGEAVGGPMTSPAEGARLSAAVAIQMLRGERAGGIHVAPIGFAVPRYDWRLLQRWNIDEARLPTGSEVVFRDPTAWERYSWEIALIAVVLLLQAGLIAGLLSERHRRRLAEVQARQRMVELAHANRFATAGEFGAMIAHEINQPLGAILSNAEAAQIILKSANPDNALLMQIVGEILHNDERASAVIKRMRSLLKKAPFEMERFDLNDLAHESVEFLATLARGRKFELRSFIATDPLPILGDRIQLQQVILNLAMNGIDAMKDMPREKQIVTIRTSRNQGFAELSVSDCGPGIPDDRLEQIFDPFFTTKAEGMGMGLSIARTIVESHAGTLVANNQTEGGAKFIVRLSCIVL